MSNLLNSAIFEGSIQSCSKLIETENKKVRSFELKNDDTLIHCEIWGRLAERAEKLKNGDRIRVVGRLKQQLWGHDDPHAVGLIIEHIDVNCGK